MPVPMQTRAATNIRPQYKRHLPQQHRHVHCIQDLHAQGTYIPSLANAQQFGKSDSRPSGQPSFHFEVPVIVILCVHDLGARSMPWRSSYSPFPILTVISEPALLPLAGMDDPFAFCARNLHAHQSMPRWSRLPCSMLLSVLRLLCCLLLVGVEAPIIVLVRNLGNLDAESIPRQLRVLCC
jgi:hypothetical protein